MLTIGDALRMNAAKAPDRLCLADTHRRFSYGEVNARVNRLSHGLLQAGCKPGDCVAILARNSIEYMELFHACSKLGLRFLTLNFWLRPGEIELLFNYSDATWLVVGEAFQESVAECLPRLPKLGRNGLIVIGESILSGARSLTSIEVNVESEPLINVEPGWSFWMMYTSGTTGNPKGVVRSFHRTAVCIWFGMIEFGFRRNDIFLAVAPFFHGVSFLPLMVLQAGGAVHIRSEFSAADVLRTFQAERITSSFLVPTMLDMLLEHRELRDTSFESMRVLVTGGAALPSTVKSAVIESMGPVLHEFYGASESGFLTVLHPNDQMRKQRCCGQPCFGAEVEIRDDSGNRLPPEVVGEIFSRCDGRFDGYYKNQAQTDAALSGGWFSAGDLGWIDSEGYVYVVDRKTDLIISGGENVYPREVEDVLRTHASIAECAVVGVPDSRWGEAVRAFVVLRPNRDATAMELVAYCGERLAGFKKPRDIEFVCELPKNASGKILKSALRQRQ
ncbi:MAG: AMP-binding protein [Burkholderiaceae bacterium]|nr:AMP-binding protein [Burkholderiaceae bacterium]